MTDRQPASNSGKENVMRTVYLFSLALLLSITAFAAKKPAAPVNLDEFYKDVVTFPGATKVPVLAREAILIDYNTNRVLLEKHADDRMVPSSMTKMMTSYIVIDKVRKGELSLDASFPVTKKAWEIQGSKMFVPYEGTVKVSDLLRGIIVQSGNDACIVAAEGISGGEAQFAAEMNVRAAALGMKNTNFKNASGWPDAEHYSTARDLAILGAAVVRDHPEYYPMYKEKDFTYNNIKQGNRNPLLYDNMNCDGIKTGHTDDGGYGVAASCVDGAQRYIVVLNGLSSMQGRADEARKLINWAKENFVRKVVAKQGDVLNKAAPLKSGVKDTIAAVAAHNVEMLVLRSEQNKLQTKVVMSESIEAPIKKGDRVGKIIVTSPSGTGEGVLVSGETVDKIGFFKRALRYIGMDV
jgi:D-alanyl-D-alanine carboxypeptidase (penicillin-binding protein 5/6)